MVIGRQPTLEREGKASSMFSAFLGLAIWWIKYESEEAAKPLYDFINAFHKAMINMALLILDYMPWGRPCQRRAAGR